MSELNASPPVPAQASATSVEPRRRADRRRGRRLAATDLRYDLVKIAVLILAYYGTAILSLRLALVRGQVTPIWPPTGIALVALLLFGRRLWPGIAVGAFLVNVPISPSPLVALGITAGNTLAPLFATALLRKAE